MPPGGTQRETYQPNWFSTTISVKENFIEGYDLQGYEEELICFNTLYAEIYGHFRNCHYHDTDMKVVSIGFSVV